MDAGAAEAARDDFNSEEALEEEEDVVVLGGEGFTPEQMAQAEASFTASLASPPAAFHTADSVCK